MRGGRASVALCAVALAAAPDAAARGWSAAEPLGRGDGYPSMALAVGPAGHAVAMWTGPRLVPGNPRRPQQAMAVVAAAQPPSGRFGPSRPVRFDAGAPLLGFAGGRFWAQWSHEAPGRSGVRPEYARGLGGTRFGPPRALTRPLSDLVAAADGRLYGIHLRQTGPLPGSESRTLHDFAVLSRRDRFPAGAPRRVARGVLDAAVAPAGRDGVVLAWLGVEGNDVRLRVQRWGPRGPRGPAREIARRPLNVCRVCGEHDEDVWESPLHLLRAAGTRDGAFALAWMDGGDLRVLPRADRAGSAVQTLAADPAGDENFNELAGLSLPRAGDLTVIWVRGRSSYVSVPRALYARRVGVAGPRGPPRRLTGAAWADHPRVVTTSRGTTLVAWRSFRGYVRATAARPGRPFARARRLSARHVRGDPYVDVPLAIAADARGGAAIAFAIPAPARKGETPESAAIFAASYSP